MNPLPREAPEEVRIVIITALSQNHYFTQTENAGSRILERMGFDLAQLPDHLLGYLEDGRRLYELQGPGIIGFKYQCCIPYDDGDDDIYVHAKITISEEANGEVSAFLTLSFHKHDTGHRPLPA